MNPPTPVSEMASPFVGLSPYDQESAEYFAGRDADIVACYDSVLTSKTTLYYGPTGSGKSSILGAGLVPAILDDNKAAGSTVALPIFIRDWTGNPINTVKDAIDKIAVELKLPSAPDFPNAWLQTASESAPLPKLILILDQFEDYFRVHPSSRKVSPQELHSLSTEIARSGDIGDTDPALAFLGSLVAFINTPDSLFNLLISLREDCLAVLDPLKCVLPSLFSSRLRLEHLDRNGIREVLDKPIRVWNTKHKTDFSISPRFRDAIFADKDLVSREWRESPPETWRYETFFLQMVLDEMWRRFGGNGFLVENYETRLHGGAGIRKSFVTQSLESSIPKEDRTWALVALGMMVSRVQKFPRMIGELEEELRGKGIEILTDRILDLCNRLVSARIMRTLPQLPNAQGVLEPRYEVMHDTLAGDIHDWRKEQQKLLDEKERVLEIEKQERVVKERLKEKRKEEERVNGALKFARRSRNWAAALGVLSILSGIALAAWGWQKGREEIELATRTANRETRKANEEAKEKIKLANEEATRKIEEATKQAEKEKKQLAEEKKRLADENTSLREEKAKTNNALIETQRSLKSKQDEISQAIQILDDADKVSSQRKNLTAIAAQLDKLTQQPQGPGDPALRELLEIWKGQKTTNDPTTATNGLIARLKGHDGDINQAVFSPDGKWIATAGQDKYLKIWTIENHAAAATSSKVASTSKGGVQSVAISPDSRSVVTGSSGQSIRIFPLGSEGWLGKEREWSQPTDDTVTCLAFMPAASPDATLRFVASYGNGMAKLLKIQNGSIFWMDETMRLNPWKNSSGKPITWIAASQDYTRTVVSSDDGNVTVWNVEPPYALVPDAKVGNPANCKAPTRRMVFSPTDSSLVAGGAGSKVVFWRIGSGQTLRLLDSGNAGIQHDGGVWQVAFDPTGKRFASIGTDGKCIVWSVPESEKSVPSGLKLETQLKGRLLAVGWNDRGLVIGAEDGHVEVWQVPPRDTPILKCNFLAHDGAVWGLTFSPDRKRLLTWSGTDRESGNLPSPRGTALDYVLANRIHSDGTAAVWDLEQLQGPVPR